MDYWRLTFDLYVDVEKLWGVGCWCTLDFNASSGPLLDYEIEIGNGPGPKLNNDESVALKFIVEKDCASEGMERRSTLRMSLICLKLQQHKKTTTRIYDKFIYIKNI